MALFPPLKNYIKQDKSVVLAVVVRGPESLVGCKALIPAHGEAEGPLLKTTLRENVLTEAQNLISKGESVVRPYPGSDQEQIEIFFDLYRSAPKLVIVGAVHIATVLVSYAQPLGYQTYVIDPRSAFATPERFPHVDYLIQEWPDEALRQIGLTGETAVVTLTHDPKLDDPALQVALPSAAPYVGALGSVKTQAQRVKRLQETGLTKEQLARLHAPIGLNIGGRTPAEIALSIMAEIVAVRNHKTVPLID